MQNKIKQRATKFAKDWANATNEQADKQTFWNEFFAIFGQERKDVALYEKAVARLGKAKGFIDVFWPGVLIVEHKSKGKPLQSAFDQASDYALNLSFKERPRYIIVSDFSKFKLVDLSTIDKQNEWSFSLSELPKKIGLFNFMSGYQQSTYHEQTDVTDKSRQAANMLENLYKDLQANGYTGKDLEILLIRLLFCLFAEDSEVFEQDQFHDYIYNHTDMAGTDLGPKLLELFDVLNTPAQNRQAYTSQELKDFPYINGGLFAEPMHAPSFGQNAWSILVDSAYKFDWTSISPAIFGSIFQNIVNPNERRKLGAHYTSEDNILKVIKPLFLDDLLAEFESIHQDNRALQDFHNKIASLKFLDPACGCGNFLVIAYRELRHLEHKVIKKLYKDHSHVVLSDLVKCNVNQFYGIELESWPAKIAQVAMWLTDIQMNAQISGYYHRSLSRIPLTAGATIVCANALTTDWQDVVKPNELNYILGNPPFNGSKMMTNQMRQDLQAQFGNYKGSGVLDFVCAWYAKAANYMIKNKQIQAALVSTNSITQGEQAGILWKFLINKGIKINFAHRTFKWSNEAKGGAAVYCVIIGFSYTSVKSKIIYDYAKDKAEPIVTVVSKINPYLVEADNSFITSRSKPICDVPKMMAGNVSYDSGHLIFTDKERDDFIISEPLSKPWFKKLIGGNELINGGIRYCLWLKDIQPNELKKMAQVLVRVKKVKEARLAAKDVGTHKLADRPHQFRDLNNPSIYLAIPKTSSENRNYLPMAMFNDEYIPSDSVRIIPNANLYHFGILTSQMHMAWMRAVAGRLKSDYRYSKDIVYNNFIWPEVGDDAKAQIKQYAQAVLDARAQYPDSTLADLYDPLTMPPNLTKAYHNLDKAVDKLYKDEPFEDDTQRVVHLFKMYKQLTKE